MTTKIKAGVIGDGVVGPTQIADDAINEAKINKTAISSQSEVTAATGDYLLVGDASASNSLKKTPISSVLSLNDTSVLELSLIHI